MKNEKKEKLNTYVIWHPMEDQLEESRFRPSELEESKFPIFSDEDEYFEELYTAEICDWWEPFSEHYSSRTPINSTEVKSTSPSQTPTKKTKANLSVKLMDMLNDDVIAKLQGIALA